MTKKIYNHTVDVRFQTGVKRSKRVMEVAEAFGLGVSDKEFVVYDNLRFQTQQGDCIYITGQSGSGKSIALNLLEDAAYYCVDNLPPQLLQPLVDQLGQQGYRKIAVAIDIRRQFAGRENRRQGAVPGRRGAYREARACGHPDRSPGGCRPGPPPDARGRKSRPCRGTH